VRPSQRIDLGGCADAMGSPGAEAGVRPQRTRAAEFTWSKVHRSPRCMIELVSLACVFR
jgi:hypothetical protein